VVLTRTFVCDRFLVEPGIPSAQCARQWQDCIRDPGRLAGWSALRAFLGPITGAGNRRQSVFSMKDSPGIIPSRVPRVLRVR